MQEQSFEQMLNDSMKDIKVGEIIKGKVISVSPQKIALNIGYKADGIITRENYSNDQDLDLTTCCKIGDEMEVKVKRLNDGEGQVVLSRRDLIDSFVKNRLKQIVDEGKGKIQKGKVIKITSGGLVIEMEPLVNVFMPKSLISTHMEQNLDKYLGEELEFFITEYNVIKRRAIADRKQIIAEVEKKQKEEALSHIKEGDVIEGTVKKLLDYGVFVDIGNVDGFLHQTEMGWGKIQNPKKIFNEGDKVRVLVKNKKENGKIDLTQKFPNEDPWLLAKTDFAIGKTVKGKVVRIVEYGAFVSLNEYIDGLLHISQISKEKVKKVEDALTIGQEIEAKVIDFNEKEKRIALSMKALLPEDEVDGKSNDEVVDVDINQYIENMKNEEEKSQQSENTTNE